jgi:hypothetical protein
MRSEKRSVEVTAVPLELWLRSEHVVFLQRAKTQPVELGGGFAWVPFRGYYARHVVFLQRAKTQDKSKVTPGSHGLSIYLNVYRAK